MLRTQHAHNSDGSTTENHKEGDSSVKESSSGAALIPVSPNTAEASGPPLQWNPMEMCTSNAKVGFLVIATLATITVGKLMVEAKNKNEAVSKYGDLTLGQIGSALVGFGFIYWHAAVKALVWKDRIVNGEESTARRYLSEEAENWVKAGAEFAACLFLFYFADRTNAIEVMKKQYSADTFWFLWIVLCAVALGTYTLAKPFLPTGFKAVSSSPQEIEKEKAAAVAAIQAERDFHMPHLQRDQTEEWKGWMQIMFLWYHYFNNTEIYNAIRLYIAAYVWMTGFGNFSFYYTKKDFSFQRFCGMQWRLNFMVFWVCAILNNEYMLYYICMLHTTFTVIIYAGLGLFQQYNTTTAGITAKMVVLVGICAVIWDTPQSWIFDKLWAPLTPLVQYHDPRRPEGNPMHEWYFRSWLDHFIWVFGMIVAFNHPNTEKILLKIDALPKTTGNTVKIAITAVTLLCCYLYWVFVFSLPKLEYNALHPYTSWIPILLFIILRNISSTLRRYHLHLFEWCGKITLETYIAQFHIWMGTVGINGAPKNLLALLPKKWYLVNFFLVSVILVLVCHRLFLTTNALKTFVIPYKVTVPVLRRNVGFCFAAIIGVNLFAFILRSLLLSTSSN